MRLQTKSQDPEAAQKPSRTASQAMPDPRHRGPAGPRQAARRPVRRYVASSARNPRRSAPEPRSGRGDRGTPPIPLTSSGMQGALRRQAHSSARSFFLLPSVLALLALALFPVMAHAESSSGATYEVEVPSIESEPSTSSHEKAPTHHKPSNTGNGETGRATGSNAETGGVGSEESETGNGSQGHKKEGSSEEEETNPSTTGGGGGGNNSNGGGGQTENGVGPAEPVAHTATGTNASESSGGSSPVVPILIAVVVLAAISIGVVLYRQRKSGQGGSDGRVSSSNAS
jgi:hypothetical protein